MINGQKTRTTLWVYLLSMAFMGLSFYFLIKKENSWFFAFPLVLMALYYYMVSLDRVVLFITLVTPLAVNVQLSSVGAALSIPTEPLMFAVLILFIANLLLGGHYNRRISHHPLTYLIYFSLFWMLITSLNSQMPVVSLKHLLSRIWFVVPFYFVAAAMFRKKANIHRFLLLYMLGLSAVIVYTLIRHAAYGFDEDAGHWVMTPFYNDHTAYGAALAMFLPIIVAYVFYPGLSYKKRLVAALTSLLFVIAVILSYSRAAWLSLVVSLVVFGFVMLRIKFRWILLGLTLLVGISFAFQNQIFNKLEKNKQDSTDNMLDHIQSMSNISSDASNLERINRWTSALRMFEQRPWLGWGPGTYQFEYAPFQRASQRTVISTNTGDRGNAHSEYLGPLAEEGIPGLLGVLLLFGYTIFTGLKIFRKGNRELRYLSLMTSLGLVTYFTHGLLNDFLNTDKLSVPVWGFMAILVALETYHLPSAGKDEPAKKKPDILPA